MSTTTANPERRRWRLRLRPLTVRFRLITVAVIAIASLLVLVAFNAVSEWRQQANLRNESATGRLGGQLSLPLFYDAQAERRLTAVYLARPNAADKAALAKQRAATDKSIELFRHLSGSELKVRYRHKWEFVVRIYSQLGGLDAIRAQVDGHTGSPDRSTGYYTDLLAEMIEFYQELSALDDAGLAVETRALVGLFWACEALSQEDMLISSARASGEMSAALRTTFAETYGTQKVMYERWIAPYLPAKDLATYKRITDGNAWKTKDKLEQVVLSAPTPAGNGSLDNPPATLNGWDTAYRQVARQIAALNLQRTQGLTAHSYQRASELRTEIYWQVGGSGAAVLAIALLLSGLIHTIIRRTGEVRAGAMTVAEDRLPKIVHDLQHGRSTDLSVLPGPGPAAKDEFDQISNAVALLAQQAADAALTVYEERRGFEQFTAGVSTRAVVIVGRKVLDLLEEMEERYGDDPELLGKLYELDHQSVRVRRLIENLLLLSGSELDHPHNRPVHVANLLMDAAGESSAFKRVVKDFRAEAWIAPHAAGELTHLLAELIDNAATFSPNDFEITVRSIQAVAGVAIEVEDRGHPLTPEQFAELNARLEEAPLYGTLAKASHQLGLFVVGQLAKRLGVTVTLRKSAYRGVLATVFVPNELLTVRPEPRYQEREPEPDLDREAPVPGPAPVAARVTALVAVPRQAPKGVSAVSRLPQRRPGSHLVEQLRDEEAPSPIRRLHAVDTRSLDEIQDAFRALDEIRTLTTENTDEPQ